MKKNSNLISSEYVAKIKNIEQKGKFHHYKSLAALRGEIEHA